MTEVRSPQRPRRDGALPFRNREAAGVQLAARLNHLANEHPVVLALPRGGVPVAGPVADRLGAELDVLVVRKLGLPAHPELAMGAVGEEGARVLDPEVMRLARVTAAQVASAERAENAEVERRAARYRNGRRPIPLEGRTVIIVDDGIATGSSALAAVQIARHRGAKRVVLAVPVAAPESARELARVVDEFVCVATPHPFMAVGQFYRDFGQVSDEAVASVLTHAHASEVAMGPSVFAEDIDVHAQGAVLRGRLTIPEGATGIVLFAHGSGSSARSPRNVFVAERLHEMGLGTLLFDLLTPSEAEDRGNVFDIDLLTERLRAATRSLQERVPQAPLGYFGASTGAAAALRAAAAAHAGIDAVVSRGGRVDLAAAHLGRVRAPTLMIVGGADVEVLRLNREAARMLRCPHELVVVPNAGHLFEEPGALDAVARLAGEWFRRHLKA